MDTGWDTSEETLTRAYGEVVDNKGTRRLEAEMKNKHKEATFSEPPAEAKLWVIEQIAKFIRDTKGHGSFRKLIYEYLNLEYVDAYLAGGMDITNMLSPEEYKKNFKEKLFAAKDGDEPEIQMHSGD